MTCYVFTGQCAKSEADLREAHADYLEEHGELVKAEWYRMSVRRMRREHQQGKRAEDVDAPESDFGLTFMCERGTRKADDLAACPCGHPSEYLCDEPLGRGKTCDAPLCRCCRTNVGPEIDRCALHAAVAGAPES